MPERAAALPITLQLVTSGRVSLAIDPLELSVIGHMDDVPARPVTALALDARGVLWLGTENGPFLFDGLYSVAPSALAVLQGTIVACMLATDSSSLWLGMRGSGLARIHLGRSGPRLACHLTEAEGLPNNAVTALCLDGRGRLWAGTQDGLAMIEHDTVTQCLGVRDALPSSTVNALCRDRHDRLWIGTERGIAVLVDGRVKDGAGGAAQFGASTTVTDFQASSKENGG